MTLLSCTKDRSTGICGTNAHVPITHCRRTATSAECYHTRTPTPTASSAGRLDSDRIQQSPAQPCLRSGRFTGAEP